MEEAKVQQYKIDAVATLKEGFEKNQGLLFADYRGLAVAQISELRAALRDVGAEFHVVKNNYAKIAFSRLNHGDVAPYLVGPTAIAYCGDDAGAVAKILLRLSKEMPAKIKGGLVSGDVYDAKSIEALSKLPSKLELVQILMGTMNAPLNNVAYALSGITTKLVRALGAVRDKKEQES